jgi:hypothetical protein
MITNDTFYGIVFERDRVQTLLNNCSLFELSGMLEYIVDRRFAGWNKAADCFRTSGWDVSVYDILYSYFQKGKITFDDLLAAYNRVTFSSINPKYQSYYVPAGTVIEDDTPALTDDFEEASKEITLNNPRWEHKDAKKKENSPKMAVFDDTVILMADVTGIPENGLVTFDIFDTSGNAPVKVGSAKGKNVGGVAKGEWVATDKTGQGEDAKLEFQAVAKSKTSARCRIPVVALAGVFFQIDLDNPHTEDDKIILQDADGNEIETVFMKNEKEIVEDYVRLVFTKVENGKKYNLIYDPGVDGFPYPVLCGVDADFLKGKKSELE